MEIAQAQPVIVYGVALPASALDASDRRFISLFRTVTKLAGAIVALSTIIFCLIVYWYSTPDVEATSYQWISAVVIFLVCGLGVPLAGYR